MRRSVKVQVNQVPAAGQFPSCHCFPGTVEPRCGTGLPPCRPRLPLGYAITSMLSTSTMPAAPENRFGR